MNRFWKILQLTSDRIIPQTFNTQKRA